MAVLKPEEYDISYFDGRKSTYAHNAGYSNYQRWYRDESNDWYDLAKLLNDRYDLKGKKVLDLGCAKGFLVEDLRSMGIDAYGIDISNYAISQAKDVVKPYLLQADARVALKKYKDEEFNLIFSRWFIYCFEDEELLTLVKDMNRVSELQVHIIKTDANTDFYNIKPIDTYLSSLPLEKGTIIIPNGNMQQILRK